MYGKSVMRTMIGALGFIAAAQLAKFVKLSMVIGSYTAFFSLNNCLLPLSGAFLGFSGASIIVLGKMILGMLLYGGLVPLSYLAFYIPGLFAAYYWASPSFIIRVMVPMVCMLLFVLHPVGGYAWFYAMYWWIPIILYYMQKNTIFMTALGSTFLAHAVGSVIWLYTVPMAATAWLALIPVVLIERLLFAVGMVLLYTGVHYVYNSTASRIVRIRRLA